MVEKGPTMWVNRAGGTCVMMGMEKIMKALDIQVGGNHYKDLKIQPVEYIHANGIGYFEGNVIKYVTRWRAKNGIKDLEKAKHYIDLLIQMESKENEHESNQENEYDWIQWNDGDCPVDLNSLVEFECRNGQTGVCHANFISWLRLGNGHDVIKYRVIKKDE